MSIYMTQFSYTAEAWATLEENPEDRTPSLRRLLESQGGRLISFYYSFGDYDGMIIYEAPDEIAASAAVLAAAKPGHLKAVRTTTLLSVDNAMEAMRKAGNTDFRAPGR